jgi:rhamnose transport system permease protein
MTQDSGSNSAATATAAVQAPVVPYAPRDQRKRLAAVLAAVATPEVIAAALLVVGFGVSATLIPYVLNADYLLDRSTLDMEAGLIAIAMTFVIGAGHIDLSVASMLALTAAIVAKLNTAAGVPIWPLVVLAPVIGGLLGAFNGMMVTRLRLPSLIVTLGTMAVYRGLTQVLIGRASVEAPATFVGFDQLLIPGGIPMPVVVFLGAAVVMSLVLHKTLFGRYVLAIGTNPEAVLYAGIPVGRATMAIFVLSGAASGAAAMMWFSRLGRIEWQHANAMELSVITAVVLGGASIFGGRATVVGSVLALLLIFVIRTAMGLKNVPEPQVIGVIGALLIVAVLLSSATARLQGRRMT